MINYYFILYLFRCTECSLVNLPTYSCINNSCVEPISPDSIPLPAFRRIIWTYWDSGIENAPPVIKPCIDSWKRLNPTWSVTVLNQESVKLLLPELWESLLNKYILPSTQQTDFIRLLLLQKYGGVWIDATVYCQKPLDDWLGIAMKDSSFFYFRNPNSVHGICTWFIAVNNTENKHINSWFQVLKARFLQIVSISNEISYFLIMEVHGILMKSEPSFARASTAMTWMFATWGDIGPHYAQILGLDNIVSPADKEILLNNNITYLHKLNWRIWATAPESVLQVIISQGDIDNFDPGDEIRAELKN